VGYVVQARVVSRRRAARVDGDTAYFSFLLNNGAPAPMTSGFSLLLQIEQHVRLSTVPETGGLFVDTSGYIYSILTRDGAEIVSYHWHPYGEGAIRFPHAHIGPALSRQDFVNRPKEAHHIHFPTGVVGLADILRLAIVELGVEPLRSDWEEILDVHPGST
jgi:hypothetical protein